MKIFSTLLEIREPFIKIITFVTLQHLKISSTLKQVQPLLRVGVQAETITLETISFLLYKSFLF